MTLLRRHRAPAVLHRAHSLSRSALTPSCGLVWLAIEGGLCPGHPVPDRCSLIHQIRDQSTQCADGSWHWPAAGPAEAGASGSLVSSSRGKLSHVLPRKLVARCIPGMSVCQEDEGCTWPRCRMNHSSSDQACSVLDVRALGPRRVRRSELDNVTGYSQHHGGRDVDGPRIVHFAGQSTSHRRGAPRVVSTGQQSSASSGSEVRANGGEMRSRTFYQRSLTDSGSWT